MSNRDQNNSIDLANGITNNHVLQKKRKEKKQQKRQKQQQEKKTKTSNKPAKLHCFIGIEKITMFILTLSNSNCWFTKHKMAFTKLIPGITISLYPYFLQDSVH